MGRRKLAGLFVAAAASIVAALVGASSAHAWQVTLTATPKVKRTYTWKIEKSVSQPALTLKAGESADVTYTVTATPLSFVDSDFRVDGTAKLNRDPNIDVNDVTVNIQLQDIVFDRNPIPATVACDPPFPVDLAVNEVNCVYGTALPDTTPRNVVMRATLVGGSRTATHEFDFSNPALDEVDETVAITDSMSGALGSATAASGAKTFTYTKTIGPFTTAQCGSRTVENTATYTTGDSATTGSASAAVSVTVTCPPPNPKCQLPSLVWGFIAYVGPQHVTPLLPISLGTPGGAKSVKVTTPGQAVMIFAKEFMTTNGVDLLATELLAAKMNQATGRDVSSIAATMAAADAFLAANSAMSWYGMSSSTKTQVLGWMNALEAYNNKCVPDHGHGDHPCKQRWDKPGHDWHKWNWKKFDWDD